MLKGGFMKRFFALFIIALVIAGCRSFTVVIKDDQFKGARVVTLDIYHKVIESYFNNTRIIYSKDIKEGKISDPEMAMDFWASTAYGYNYHGDDLSEKAQLLIDGTVFQVKLYDRKNVKATHFDLSRSYGGMSSGIAISSSYTSTLSAKLRLTPDIQQALARATEYKIRIYAGDTIVTMKAESSQLEAVKLFIAADGRPAAQN